MDRKVILFPSYSHVKNCVSQQTLRPCLGVEITTLSLWLEDRWDIYGTEERLITPDQRLLIIEHLLSKQDCLPKGHNTAQLIAQFFLEVWGDPCFESIRSSFMDEQSKSNADLFSCDSGHANSNNRLYEKDSFSVQEIALFVLSYEYQHYLNACNLIEPGQAYRRLAEVIIPEQFEVYEFLSLPSGFLVCCEQSKSKLVIHEPTIELHSSLDDIQPDLLYASGSTALPYLVSDYIVSLLKDERKSVSSSQNMSIQVLVATKNPDYLFNECAPKLVREHLCVGAVLSKHLNQTKFGQAFIGALSLWKGDDIDIGAVSDFLLSPFSDLSVSSAYKLSAKLRSDRLVHSDELKAFLRSVGESYSFFEELFESSDASIVLGYFDDKIDRSPCFDKAFKAEQHAAISAIRSLYDAGHRLGLKPDDFIELLNSLYITIKNVADENNDDIPMNKVDVIIAPYSWACDYVLAGVDHVIACDLDDQSFPAKEDHSALVTLRRKIGLPLVEEELNSLRMGFSTLQSSARKSFGCAVCLANDEGEETYPAFFFDEFLATYRQEGDKGSGFDVPLTLSSRVIMRGEEHFAENLTQNISECTTESLKYTAGSVLLNQAYLSSKKLKSLLSFDNRGKTILSPSAIEEYLECPYRWFVRRKLSPEGLDEVFGPLEKGLFCHEVFASFYERFKQKGYQRVTAGNLNDARELLSICFDDALAGQRETNPPRYLPITKHEQFSARQLKVQLIDSLDNQAGLFDGFVPRLCEFAISPEMHCDYAGVVLNGRVDRVDVNDEFNQYVVIDYKGSLFGHSAGYSPDDDFVLPRKVQTLIYAQAIQKVLNDKHCVGAMYFSYSAKSRKKALAGSYDPSALNLDSFASQKDKVDMNFQSYLDLVEKGISEVVSCLLDGCIEASPQDKASCERCPVLYCERRLS